MKMKKSIRCFVTAMLIALPVLLICSSSQYFHKTEKGLLGDYYIVPEKFLQYISGTNSYIEHTCVGGLYFNCVKRACYWPNEVCPCLGGSQ